MPILPAHATNFLGTWMALAAIAFSTGACATSTAAGETVIAAGEIHQLRIYEIFEHNKSAFHDRFRDHAARIMRKYGFTIVSMWESRSDNRTEFVYLLRWPSEEVMKAQWSKFMADQEWADIKKETAARHGTLVGKIEDRVLRLTAYSPGRTTK